MDEVSDPNRMHRAERRNLPIVSGVSERYGREVLSKPVVLAVDVDQATVSRRIDKLESGH